MSIIHSIKGYVSKYPAYYLARRYAGNIGLMKNYSLSILEEFVLSNTIFIHIPKCAGNAVTKSLYNADSINLSGHASALDFKNKDKDFFSDSFKFSVVRDPVQRFISAFEFLKDGGLIAADRQWKRAFLSDDSTLKSLLKRANNPIFRASLFSYPLFRPQHKYICDQDGTILVDYIARQEFIDDEFSKICELSWLSGSLRFAKKTNNKSDRILDISTINKIKNLYRKDYSMMRSIFPKLSEFRC